MSLESPRRHPPLAIAAIVLETVLALGAIGGGIALILGPRGEIVGLPVSALAGSPFDSYLVPGVVLFAVLGLGSLVGAVLAWRAHPVAPLLTIAVGGALLIWLVVQISVIGFSTDPPLQPIYLGMGLVIAAIGVAWSVDAARHGHLRAR
jgi:hypothetical protein